MCELMTILPANRTFSEIEAIRVRVRDPHNPAYTLLSVTPSVPICFRN